MKKVLLLILLLLLHQSAFAEKFVWRSGLTGGGDALDGILSSTLTTGDVAKVTDSGKEYFFRYDSTDTTAENSPRVVEPDDDSVAADGLGVGAWTLQTFGGTADDVDDSTTANRFITADQQAALDGAASPSGANPVATVGDITYFTESTFGLEATNAVYHTNGEVFVATKDTIYKSTDGGNSFTELETWLNSGWFPTLFIDSRGYLYASPFDYDGNIATATAGLWRSVNRDNTWTRVITNVDMGGVDYAIGAMAEDSSGNLYASQYGGDPTVAAAEIFVSTNAQAGGAWNPIANITVGGTNMQSTRRHMHDICVDTTPNPDVLYAVVGEFASATASEQGGVSGEYSVIKTNVDSISWSGVLDTFPTVPQQTGIFCGDGYRLIGSDDTRPSVAADTTIIKTIDDSTYGAEQSATFKTEWSESVGIDCTHVVWDFSENPLTGTILTSSYVGGRCESSFDYPNLNAKILASGDDGDSWEIIKEFRGEQGDLGSLWIGNFYQNQIMIPRKTALPSPGNYFDKDSTFDKTLVLTERSDVPDFILQNPVFAEVPGGALHDHRGGDGAKIPMGALENYSETDAGLTLISSTGTSSPGGDRGLVLEQNNTNIHAAQILAKKSRGTNAAKAAIASGDYIFTFIGKGYDGSQYTIGNTAYFGLQANGTISSNSVPTDFIVATGDGDNVPGPANTLRLKLTAGGVFSLFGDNGEFVYDAATDGLTISTDASSTDRGIFIKQHSTDASGALIEFHKSRGTEDSKSAVGSGDFHGTFVTRAYDATGAPVLRLTGYGGWQGDGTVGVGSIPTKFVIHNADTGGTVRNNFEIGADRSVTLGGLASTYVNNSAYACVNNSGEIYASETACP